VTDFDTLIADHREILRLIAVVEEIAEGSAPRAIEALRALTRLHATLAEHLRREDDMMYPRLIDHSEIAISRNALAMVSEFHYLTGDLSLYLLAWPESRIACAWTDFGEDTMAMMGRLRARLEHENALLYPMVRLAGQGLAQNDACDVEESLPMEAVGELGRSARIAHS
jgi:hemerythrin-like domain-containing protein